MLYERRLPSLREIKLKGAYCIARGEGIFQGNVEAKETLKDCYALFTEAQTLKDFEALFTPCVIGLSSLT